MSQWVVSLKALLIVQSTNLEGKRILLCLLTFYLTQFPNDKLFKEFM